MANNFKNKPLSRELTRPLNEVIGLFQTAVDAEDIAECLEVPYGQMKHILYAYSEEKKYTTFEIPKKSGGVRQINSPNRSIAILQQKLKLILDEIVPTNLSSHGFVKGRSIVTNAKNHTKRRYVLNFDLENFFPSINFGRVRGVFMAPPFKLGVKAATVVAQIVCHKKKLPQGACTSPVIANHIAKRLDGSMRNICRRAKCSYTRYADDITISTSHKKFPRLIAHYSEDSPMHEEVVLSDQVLRIVADSGFQVNDRKTRLQIKSCGQQVTGLLVNEFVNVPRSFIDKTRAMLYSWRKYGIKSAAEYSKGLLKHSDSLDGESLEEYYKNSLIGRMSYIKMVRGEGDIIFTKLACDLAGLLSEGPEFIMNYKNMKKSYDVFIGHASEDKDMVALPIKSALDEEGVSNFIDIEDIKWGDSLTGRINYALSKSKIFLAILSVSSVAKEWPVKEVNSALSREIDGRQTFLPLIVGDADEVLEAYPMIKEKLYVVWSGDAGSIAESIKGIVGAI